ncbi:MAG: hypothetical protein M0Z50_09800 [Planctomycetia bacterium]|nr:hypothetical protein [Planctomycetia bacterium]
MLNFIVDMIRRHLIITFLLLPIAIVITGHELSGNDMDDSFTTTQVAKLMQYNPNTDADANGNNIAGAQESARSFTNIANTINDAIRSVTP